MSHTVDCFRIFPPRKIPKATGRIPPAERNNTGAVTKPGLPKIMIITRVLSRNQIPMAKPGRALKYIGQNRLSASKNRPASTMTIILLERDGKNTSGIAELRSMNTASNPRRLSENMHFISNRAIWALVSGISRYSLRGLYCVEL